MPYSTMFQCTKCYPQDLSSLYQGSKFEEDLPTSISESLLHVIIETKDSGEFIGYTRLFKHSYKNRDAILGIALLPEFWGRGYATEVLTFIIDYAFQQLAMHRISLGTFANNTAAIKVYKRVGFVQEGVRRKANWMDGKWQDEILMAVLDEDWAASRQNGADA
ncbi:acyl-CoA N-acyltransferase [Gymnopus androsaceus JB14]|uniref:Acyl-CoA N-acyltransferase n=1 Tax=Gymnopus androsaceus JB14 TaxID=1447944 RepID=A0A6A4I4I2_9AGAR|nr:acyl-CoA N-acyltransferase [Gymnopus androsaceus JB14]